jgi:hypothetical protein
MLSIQRSYCFEIGRIEGTLDEVGGRVIAGLLAQALLEALEQLKGGHFLLPFPPVRVH